MIRSPVPTATPQNSCPKGLGSSPSRSGASVPSVEGDLDLDEHVAWLGLRPRHVFEPHVSGPVEEERLHRVK